MTLRSVAVADDPVVQEAADDVLLSGGSALGAVAAGFFAAAGAHSGVLLSPLSLITAGAGLGARAFDGRCRQPGLGTKRPRGFKEGESIPDAARVGVPAAITALLVALGYEEQTKVSRVVRFALKRARDSGADGRAEILERIRAVGAGAVSEAAFARPLIHVAGEAVGGALTTTDLRGITDVDVAATSMDAGGARWVVAPWALTPYPAADADTLGRGHAICAVDVRGAFVGLTYRRVMTGLPIEETELEAPLVASPVLRGVTRVAPGAPIACPAPVAIRLDETGSPVEIVAAPAALALDAETLASARLRIRWDSPNRRGVVVKG
jgi:gamma-glutamyltranspeptidase/glutathione hydrolase